MSEITGNVLIVEDDNGIRETYQLALELEGYHVFTATNGQEAFEVIEKVHDFCLILLDLMMPVMNGWDFLSKMRQMENLSSVPVVIITAYKHFDAPSRIQGFLLKPVDLDRLSSVVKNYCKDA